MADAGALLVVQRARVPDECGTAAQQLLVQVLARVGDDSRCAVAPLEARRLLVVVDRGGPVDVAVIHDRCLREHRRGLPWIAERLDVPDQPVRRAEDAKAYSRKPGFTDTRLWPLARRREITARPLLVFIRVRNPWVLERCRRLGWNVRLGMEKYLLLSGIDGDEANEKYK